MSILLDDFRNTLYFRVEEEVFRRGLASPLAHIAEFPKSGGSWVQSMTIDIVTRGKRRRNGSSCRVIHHHWSYKPAFRPAIYVLRDGRDVVISLYFFHVRYVLLNSMWKRRVERYFTEILGPGYDLDDASGNLPRFIHSLSERPHGGTLKPYRDRAFATWPQHVHQWSGREGVLVVRYETLLTSTVAELRRIADHLAVEISDGALEAIAATHSFAARSGRRPGSEDRRSFMRRGIAGEWRELFTAEAGAAFEEYAGPTLLGAGYESDPTWFHRLESRPAAIP